MHSSLPIFALLLNALIWGLSWWPLRLMNQAGLHPLWAMTLMYGLVLLGLLVLRPASLRQLWQFPVLLLLAASSGLNNMAFNWAMTVGDVVRVILLFYLMPAWAVLLAWRILGEKPTRSALLRLLLAFGGVFLVLLPEGSSIAGVFANLSLADGLAVFGGFMFALTNVLLRRFHRIPTQARMLAMFGGGTSMALMMALLGSSTGAVPGLPGWHSDWVLIVLLMSFLMWIGNWALQYGAARLPAGVTTVVMLSEVMVASVSSVLIAQEHLSGRTLAGGALIMSAALLAALTPAAAAKQH